jgi:hypothetical protein
MASGNRSQLKIRSSSYIFQPLMIMMIMAVALIQCIVRTDSGWRRSPWREFAFE